jgi:hypothetical protein
MAASSATVWSNAIGLAIGITAAAGQRGGAAVR